MTGMMLTLWITTAVTSIFLLFVYQTELQRRLLRRYGNELKLLDATYRTTRNALPLFFLVVKTNVDYKNIAEAMRTIREWNPHFLPRYFMINYSNEEIKATEQVLPGTIK